MTDVADFLLARIAEDEVVAVQLDECEAKRPIVAQFSDTAWCGCAVRDYVLGQLALPYAGHPDYQEAWRP